MSGSCTVPCLAPHDHRHFIAGVVEADFVHEVLHQHQAAPSELLQRARIVAVGNAAHVESTPLVANDERGLVQGDVGLAPASRRARHTAPEHGVP